MLAKSMFSIMIPKLLIINEFKAIKPLANSNNAILAADPFRSFANFLKVLFYQLEFCNNFIWNLHNII